MKFADEYFDEIKAGTVLIFIDEDDDFTKGGEYEVKKDEEGLFVVDDVHYEQLLNEVLAQYFVIKEPGPDTKLLKELEGLRRLKALLIEKKRKSEKYQNEKNMMCSNKEMIAAVYQIKDLDRQIAQTLADLEKEGAR